ncbi:conserved hypothetical protein [Syntrophomonas wolfei subsp. wolfei str. Goettingen G311]|uniref:Ger(X)C family spore germination protein n=2 Tax=Syntrophomonas wolfei TaxID=863 RepID=Q0B0S0_SYNWW|nr:conserved hypothetical protein [Syntrophomonas wolfei subsp. wolfei str. Goettingen G311]
MKKSFLLLFLLLLGFNPGCGVTELDKASIPLGLGVDVDGEQIVVSTELASPISPEQIESSSGPDFYVISGRGPTVVEAARKITLQIPRNPLWSHTNTMIIGEKLARQDMALFMDFLSRNRYVRKNIPVFVSSQSTPEEILSVKPPIEPHPSIAIKNILSLQEKQLGIYVPIDLKEMEFRFLSPGIEPLVPQVSILESDTGKRLRLEGAAVFRGRKMVGSFNEMESRGYRWMSPRRIQGGLFLVPSPLHSGKQISLELSRSQAQITPKLQEGAIIIQIKIKAEGNFYEQNEVGELFTRERFRGIEELANQEIKRQILLAINKAQELNSDVFGWGQMIKQNYPQQWEKMEGNWDELFPTVGKQIKVDFSLRRSYLADRSFKFQ